MVLYLKQRATLDIVILMRIRIRNVFIEIILTILFLKMIEKVGLTLGLIVIFLNHLRLVFFTKIQIFDNHQTPTPL